jgi:MFS family permease
VSERGDQQAAFLDVFRVGEFQALWWAQVLSIIGDQLARVALTLLVFARTHSAALTALTYALTFLPDLFGGPLLSGLADRFPRRSLMVVTDIARAALVGLMAVPGMPLVVVCVLLVAVQLLASPFNAARGAVLPSILDGDLFVAGQALVNITYQVGQLGGYVAGGVLVTFTGSQVALAIDAGTFLASAVLVRFGLTHRPVPVDAHTTSKTTLASLRAGATLVWRNRALRALVTLACVAGFYITAEGLAVPYARELGGGAITAGLLFAANPAGAVIGMTVLTRLVTPDRRLRLLGPLAVASCAVLMVCAFQPNLAATLIVWGVSGAATSFQTVAAAAFVRSVPDSGRGQAFGLASTSLRVSQGLGVVIAGALAQGWAPSTVVAVAGAVGTGVAVLAAVSWYRAHAGLPSASATATAS